MNTYRPLPARTLCFVIGILIWTAIGAGVWLGFVRTYNHFVRISREAPINRTCEWAVMTLIAAIGAASLAARPSAYRFEVRATDLVSRRCGSNTTTVPILEIDRIETSQGWLLRLFGLTDLRVYSASRSLSLTLPGLPDAEEVKRRILERRDALREAVLEGEVSVGKPSLELVLERLARAIDRRDPIR